jgi:hypothetical protein
MAACVSALDSRHHKMLHAYIKSVLVCLQRHPEVRAEEITVACFGGALQMHLPHCMALLGPNMRWEMWREDGKFAPLFQEHLTQKVQQHVGTTQEYLQSVEARKDRRFICLVDIDINTAEHAYRLNNKKGVTPSVATENHFYESFTRPYARMCRLAAAMPHVLLLSMPFRAPWFTSDYERNKQHAMWTQADESMLHPLVDKFKQYNTRPRSSEMRAICWCAGHGVRDENVDWKQIDVDMAAYNARRLFRDHDKLHELMLEYAACTAGRPDLFENESSALEAWRAAFVHNSIAFAAENKAHAELAAPENEARKLAAQDGGAGRHTKHVRFSTVL